MISNLLSSNEIADILNNPVVKTNKEKLSTLEKVDFFIELPDEIKQKLDTGLATNLLSKIHSIPMRWIKGDIPSHKDKGKGNFNTTYLIYLTDSIGNLIVDGQSYPITAGDAHIFREGLEHSTINTGDSERLLIGPMSESGFQVGISFSIVYFNNQSDANEGINSIGYNDEYTDIYKIMTINDISSWNIARNEYGTDPSPNGGPYTTGTELINTGTYYLYPYVAPPQPIPTRIIYMGSLFSNNAQVYYKPHSLSSGGCGSVRNSRHKQFKT